MKLFKVRLRGLGGGYTGIDYGTSYVVAEDPTSAYVMVRKFIDENDFGFQHERELYSVELIADSYRYCDCRTLLFLPDKEANHE